MDTAAVEVRNLTKNFGTGSSMTKVLRGMNISIMPGEFVIIFGPSGSGKSTLLNIINGLENPTSGQVIIDGEDISRLEDNARARFHQNKIGMVFQAYNLISSLTVSQNITLPLVFGRHPLVQREQRAKELLQDFALTELEHRLPSEISGGQAQRVGVMRALVNNPPIIVADEPTGNLDSVSSKKVMDLFCQLSEKYHNTLIVVTHDQGLFRYADRIIHVLDGTVIKEVVRASSKTRTKSEETVYDRMLAHTKKPDQRRLLRLLHAILSPSQLSSFDQTELDRTIEFIQSFSQGKIDSHELYVALDKPVSEGGAGLYRSTAHHLAESMENMLEVMK